MQKRHELQARVFQALGHPFRVAIVELLRDGEVCVCDIAGKVGAERSNVSRHLAVMLQAGIVSSRKEGLQVFYALRTPCILDFLSCATKVVAQSVEEDARALSGS
jgi:ArsR family transcriptional regulator